MMSKEEFEAKVQHKLAVLRSIKGDVPGHEFHGNQYTGGGGGSGSGGGGRPAGNPGDRVANAKTRGEHLNAAHYHLDKAQQYNEAKNRVAAMDHTVAAQTHFDEAAGNRSKYGDSSLASERALAHDQNPQNTPDGYLPQDMRA